MIAEYLPATVGASLEIVLLHGWGSSREVWRPLLSRLRAWANVTLLDVPGVAPGAPLPCGEVGAALDEVLAQCPPRAVYLGWSLGGQLAIEIASRRPQRALAVVTLASNPHFTALEDWPGMDPRTLAAFTQAARTDSAATARRFDSLQSSGAGQPRPMLRRLQALRDTGQPDAPLAGLHWLAALDQREQVAALVQPQLHLLAAGDALVPAALAPVLRELVRARTNAAVEVVPEACHALPLQCPEQIAARLRAAFSAWGLLAELPALPAPLDKRDIAVSFSRAAASYDSVARLQRDVGNALLQRALSPAIEVRDVLDMGSGTGFFCEALAAMHPAARYLGLDLAEGMVRYARDHHDAAARWAVADAEAMPLAAASQDLVFSSLAIQWCPRPALLFAELARVLRPGGRCVFSTLGPGTLGELRAAWAEVDGYQHVNDFAPVETLQRAAATLHGVKLQLEVQTVQMRYAGVRDLLLELKALGAHNVNRQRPAGLTGPGALRRMMAAYERRRADGAIPASYEIVYGVLEKT